MLIRGTNKTNYLTQLHALATGTVIRKHFTLRVKFCVARLAQVTVGIGFQGLLNPALFASTRQQQKQQAATDPNDPIKVSFFHRPVTIRAHRGNGCLW